MRITLVNADLPSATPVPPLGVVSLAAAATRAGHEAQLRDYQLSPTLRSRDPETFARFCSSSDPVLGVSTSCQSLPLVVLALRRMREVRNDLITVLGGIGAAGAAERIIKEFPWIDFVARGEGEECLPELLDLLERGGDTSRIEGFVCRRDGDPVLNAIRPRNRDLDRIEARAWDYLDLNRYALINIQSARGCPFPCTFCDVSPYWGRRYVERSLEAVLTEIRETAARLEEQQPIVFVDDTLTIRRQRVEELCTGIKEIPGPVEWACYARAETLDEELLELMASSGCRKVYLGLESGSDRMLKEMRKGFTVEVGRQAAVLARQYIPIVQTSFVWGFPYETWDDFYETLLMMGYLVTHGVSVKANVLTPLPFSTLFSKYAGSMVFLPDYSPQLHLAGFETHPDLTEIILRHPDIFPCFYLYDSESLTQKYDLLREMGLSPEHIWDLWESVKGPVPAREVSIRS